MELERTSRQAEFATINSNRLKAAATYDAAADHFDAEPLSFWDRHGRRTVEFLNIAPGEKVLDVGCGTGASAIPAAIAAGPTGHVTGVDVAEKLLELAHAKAKQHRLTNTTFELSDMTELDHPDQSFDAVISVFSVFFVEDMERLVSSLWRLLRPGGRLAVTVWAPDPFQPCAKIFGEEVSRKRPDISLPTAPWERLTDPRNLRQLFLDGGTAEPQITQLPDRQPLQQPDDFWTIALGSGFRWLIEQLTPEERLIVRARTVERLARTGVTDMASGGICAIAQKAR